jgi:hypothetical protein
VLAHLTDITNHADRSLVLGVILGSIKSTHLKCRTCIDGGVAGGADVEFGKLVELYLHRVGGVAFALGFRLLGLVLNVSHPDRGQTNRR